MKQCNYCKAENNDEVQYCCSCGLPILSLVEEAETSQVTAPGLQPEGEIVQEAIPHKKKRSRRSIIGAVAVVALVVVLLTVFLFQSVFQTKSKFMFPETTMWVSVDASGNATNLVAGTKVVGEPVEGEVRYTLATSLDGRVKILMNGNYEAYVATKDGFSYLSDIWNLALAASGERVAYVDRDYVLHLQKTSDEESSIRISERISHQTSSLSNALAISPDGNTVAYIEEENGEPVLYVYQDGKSTRIGDNLLPLALSDHGKYIYCTSYDSGALSLADLSGKVTQITEYTGSYYYILNKDHTQLLFYADDAWFVLNHGEEIEISDLSSTNVSHVALYMVIPTGASVQYAMTSNVITYGVETLADNYYTNDNHMILSYVDKNWDTHVVSEALSDSAAYAISRDGNTLFYLEDNKLYQIKDGDVENEKRLAKDIKDFVITSDGKAFYYLDEDNTLWYQKGTGDAKELESSVYSMQVTHDDYLLFLINDSMQYGAESDLYAVKDGKKPVFITDKVSYVYVTAGASYYFQFSEEDQNYTYDVYGTEKGTKFTFVTKEL